MELYKYTGSVAALTVRFGKAETITLYDSYDELVCFGCPNFINTTKPVSMGQDDYQNFLMWKRENRD